MNEWMDKPAEEWTWLDAVRALAWMAGVVLLVPITLILFIVLAGGWQ